MAELFLTDIPDDMGDISGIVFSGGVGAYVTGQETMDFGDLGIHLGAILRDRAKSGDLGAPVLEAGASIRATALGASEYSVQLSGQTSTVTAPGKLLPRRNLQVLKPALDLSTLAATAPHRSCHPAITSRPSTLMSQKDEAVIAFDVRRATGIRPHPQHWPKASSRP